MQKHEELWTSQYVNKNRRRKLWQRIVSILACVVVFCTTYALILPAITEEKESFCGFEEHVHTDECYAAVTEAPAETKTSADMVEPAATEAPVLICQLEEKEAHTHTEDCVKPAHTHTEDCYGEPELICGQEEGTVHTHSDACFGEEVLKLVCTLPETKAHTHSDQCYTTKSGELICTLQESEGHSHAEGCYGEDGGLVCTLEPSEGHSHGDGCYAEDTSELTCGQEQTDGHSHGEDCYVSEGKPLICTSSDTQAHVHSDACYGQPALICGLEERETDEQVCILEETEGHTHIADCYEKPAETDAVTQAPETVPSTENPEQTEPDRELVCGLEEHTHELICFSDKTADVETEEIWEKTLPGNLTGVWREDVLAIAASQLGYEESTRNYIVENDTVYGYSRYGDWYGDEYGDWCAMFVSFCLHYAGVENMPYDSTCQDWIEELTEAELYTEDEAYLPQPGDVIFFDLNQNGRSNHVGLVETVTEAADETECRVTTIEGNSGDCVQRVTYNLTDERIMGYAKLPYQLSEQEQAQVDSVIAMIDAMPSADEIDAKMLEFEEAEDYEGLEVWYTQVCQQIAGVYHSYSQLSDELKSKVTNADKLLELEYIWSVTTLELVNSFNVYQVNSYDSASTATGSATSAIIVRGARGTTVGDIFGQGMEWWYAAVVELKDGQYVVTEVHQSGAGLSKSDVYAPYDGFIFLIWSGDNSLAGTGFNVQVGDYVFMSSSFWRDYNAYTGTALGSVRFYDTPVDHDTPFWSAPTRVTKNVADTRDFVNLNLYDYGSNINYKFKNETFSYGGYSGVNLWPGFQWNGGAYNLDGDFHRHEVDFIDFGNSLITDLQYGSQIEASYSYAKSANAVSVGKTYNYSNAEPETTGIINRLWRNGTDWSTLTNRPMGMSMNSTVTTTSEANYDVLKPILSPSGYPVVLASDEVSGFSGVLDYLFSDNTYADKQNSSTINGLFQINPISGEYYFNSRWNHAQYDSGSNTFKLYEEVITPNFIIYPFGNFMPFNKITDGLTSANVKDIEAGTLKNYLAEEVSQKLAYSDPSEAQLRHMLSFYRTSLNPDTEGSAWHTYSGLDAIQDYFWGDGGSYDDTPSEHTSDISELVNNGDLYNIDYDVHKNFFFGMDMSMRFYQPKDGLTGNDNGDNANGTWSTVATSIPSYRRSPLYVEEDTQRLSGSPDGISDYPMKFYFTGDDDVWVYIDGMLFLDLTGIHRHVGGEIDFQKGVVNYFELDVVNTGDVDTANPYQTFTFKDLVTKAIKFKNRNNSSFTTEQLNAAINEIINPDTGRFYDYSSHEFKFFYMERGSGSSVCRMNFNFPLLRQNSISVEKEVTADTKILGNPDYKFQVLKADSDGTKTEQLFIVANTEYTVYDASDNVIGTGKTDSNGVFALKAGQRAEFTGIKENAGKYYVRELLDGTILDQYGNVTVSGQSATTSNNVNVGSDTFTGMDSPVKDMSDGATAFRFTNDVDEDELGDLSISKILTEYSGTRTVKTFDVQVALDGELLPVGAEYTVGEETRTVETAGIITIAAGERALISDILAGTKFTVQETSGSAEGYTVTYTESGGNTITVEDGIVKGTILSGVDVQLVVTNSEKGTNVTIPGTKSQVMYDGTERTYSFQLTEVTDETGDIVKEGGISDYSASVELRDAPVDFSFTINYAQAQMEQLPQNFYYRITEHASSDNSFLKNDTVYVAEVTVNTDESGELSAFVSGMWKDGDEITDREDFCADFVNTLTGNLGLEKIVDGGTEAQQTGFTFTITLDLGSSGLAQLPTTYPAVFYQADGSTVETQLQLTEGQIKLTEFKHGERAVISGIPLGTYWKIEEQQEEGFIVKTEVTVDGEMKPGTTTITEGNITSGGTQVVYTNQQTYELPETGGTGTTIYTMAGLILVFMALCLMYIVNKRRKEVINF